MQQRLEKEDEEEEEEAQSFAQRHLSFKRQPQQQQQQMKTQQQFDKILAERNGAMKLLSEKETKIEELKNQLRSSMEAEEQSTKAMDGLALALKEVATESNKTKEKLSLTDSQLQQAKTEMEQLKELLRSHQDKYSKLLDQSKKENEFQKNVIERLRLEAEESLLAWNEKETGLVDCIKNFEDEKGLTMEDNTRLMESLKMAETTARTLREENHKLRDILKQGLKEANVAKEAAVIATEENCMLKECLAEKDEALDIITRENESLRISEAAARESIKELKRLLSSSSSAAAAAVTGGPHVNPTSTQLSAPPPLEDTTTLWSVTKWGLYMKKMMTQKGRKLLKVQSLIQSLIHQNLKLVRLFIEGFHLSLRIQMREVKFITTWIMMLSL